MAKLSAGLLAYRFVGDELQVLLVHPGGPFWRNKDEGTWSIPKGEYQEGEDPLEVARREFYEETGNRIEAGEFIELAAIKMKSGKRISAWAVEVWLDQPFVSSNTFEMEWPPNSGKMQTFPEVDKAGWFGIDEAMKKLNAAQTAFIIELKEKVSR